MKSSEKHAGQSLHEYAIAIALLAVVGIGALKLLGGNISGLLGKAGNVATLNETEQLYSLIDTKIGQKQSANKRALHSGNTTQEVVIKFNPATGQVDIIDTNSDGTNSTSINGGEVVMGSSMALAQLAETKMANGEALPDDIQAMLLQLSEKGANLGTLTSEIQNELSEFMAVTQQIELLNQQGKYGGPPYYDATAVGLVIDHAENYIQMSQTYEQLNRRLTELAKTDSSMADLQGQVSGYTGAITGINLHSVGIPTFSQFSIDNINPNDLNASLSKAPHALMLFAPLAAKTQSMSPEMRKAIVQQGLISLGKGMLAGEPIDSPTGITIALPTVPTATASKAAGNNKS